MSEKKKKLKLKAPNAMLILVIIVLASAIASYVVPAGLYDRVADPATGRMLVNPDTFHYIDQTPIGFFEFFEDVYKRQGNICVSLFDLKEQDGFSIDGDRRVPSASMIKLVIMAELMRRV